MSLTLTRSPVRTRHRPRFVLGMHDPFACDVDLRYSAKSSVVHCTKSQRASVNVATVEHAEHSERGLRVGRQVCTQTRTSCKQFIVQLEARQ